MRKAMSPVPPAMSSTRKGTAERRGGASQVTKASFHRRWTPAGHEVVHQVVAAGDRVEDVVDQALLLGGRHLAEAEGGPLAVVPWAVRCSACSLQ